MIGGFDPCAYCGQPEYRCNYVKCARCGKKGCASNFVIEEGEEWECAACNEREDAREREW